MKEVADVEVPNETLALANTQIPPPASSDTSIDVQSLAHALSEAAGDIRSSAGAQPPANTSASGGLN